MQVSVRLFAGLRERAGRDTLWLRLPDGARVADALATAEVRALTGDLEVVLAVNREYAAGDRRLAPGDELALIPPVSGGEGAGAGAPDPRLHVRVGEAPLSLDRLLGHVRDPRAGALVTFTGVTREVDALVYEAYAEMAVGEIRRILRAAIARHGLCAASAEHRTGTVPLSEASVAIAVSAPHRAEAFAGGREIIDAIKTTAPIWKREADRWVAGAIPRPAFRPPGG